MTNIVLGFKSVSTAAIPEVVYVGGCGDEAQSAVNNAGGDFVQFRKISNPIFAGQVVRPSSSSSSSNAKTSSSSSSKKAKQ